LTRRAGLAVAVTAYAATHVITALKTKNKWLSFGLPLDSPLFSVACCLRHSSMAETMFVCWLCAACCCLLMLAAACAACCCLLLAVAACCEFEQGEVHIKRQQEGQQLFFWSSIWILQQASFKRSNLKI